MKDQCYEFLLNQIGRPNIIGFGSYGEVKIAKNTQTNEIVAIKLIHGKNAKQQIDVHHKLNHPNIIKLINYYYEKDKNITYMVLQIAENGSLNQKIKFSYGLLSKQLIRSYFKDICQAIKYLHSNNYMHRDIKPQNILITKQNIAKLCDFGFTAIFQARTTVCGTFQYMAPQMIKKRPYNYKIDIWALGILLFQLVQGSAPFKGQKAEQVLNQMRKPIKFSQRFQSLQIDLIKMILRVNPENRPTVDQILSHPYFKQSIDKQKQKQQKVFTKKHNFINFHQNKGDVEKKYKKSISPYWSKVKENKQKQSTSLFKKKQKSDNQQSLYDNRQKSQRKKKHFRTQPNNNEDKKYYFLNQNILNKKRSQEIQNQQVQEIKKFKKNNQNYFQQKKQNNNSLYNQKTQKQAINEQNKNINKKETKIMFFNPLIRNKQINLKIDETNKNQLYKISPKILINQKKNEQKCQFEQRDGFKFSSINFKKINTDYKQQFLPAPKQNSSSNIQLNLPIYVNKSLISSQNQTNQTKQINNESKKNQNNVSLEIMNMSQKKIPKYKINIANGYNGEVKNQNNNVNKSINLLNNFIPIKNNQNNSSSINIQSKFSPSISLHINNQNQ